MFALTRREALVAGGLGTVGLSLPGLLANSARSDSARAKSVILVVPWGGPAQVDTLDMKPDAPEEVRGEFKPVATRVPGLRICEHLPRLAERAGRFAVVRSLSHGTTAHNPATYLTLTGHDPVGIGELTPPRRTDWPSIGSVIARDQPAAGVPGYVAVPGSMVEKGVTASGQHAGFLGTRFDPFVVTGDPSAKDFRVPDFTPSPDLPPERFAARRGLLEQLDTHRSAGTASSNGYREQAYDLLGGVAASPAFDLSREPERTRSRYGLTRLGQSTLLARRLVEAGVRLVLVNDATPGTNSRWDTHEGTYPAIERNLKEADGALGALLEDLHDRGLLASTLVVWMAEFGRSPKADEAGGRDHWPHCYSALLAGGGIRGGVVHGSSDRVAAYPRDGACSPADVHATIYHLLGLPLRTELTDATGRPGRRCDGEPIRTLLT